MHSARLALLAVVASLNLVGSATTRHTVRCSPETSHPGGDEANSSGGSSGPIGSTESGRRDQSRKTKTSRPTTAFWCQKVSKRKSNATVCDRLQTIVKLVNETRASMKKLSRMYSNETQRRVDKIPSKSDRISEMLEWTNVTDSSNITKKLILERFRDGVQVILAVLHQVQHVEVDYSHQYKKSEKYVCASRKVIRKSTSSGLLNIRNHIDELAPYLNMSTSAQRCYHVEQRGRLELVRTRYRFQKRIQLVKRMTEFLNASHSFVDGLNGTLQLLPRNRYVRCFNGTYFG